MHARYDAALPPYICIVRSPSCPVISIPEACQERSNAQALTMRSHQPTTGVPGGVFPRVSLKTGLSEGVSHGVSPGHSAFGLRSVQNVFRECSRGVLDTLEDTLKAFFEPQNIWGREGQFRGITRKILVFASFPSLDLFG